MINIVVVVAVAVVAALVFSPKMRASMRWRATVTPLASIIGSGFLVVTPLLASVVGSWAPLAMIGIVLLAYWVGAAMRFVIAEVEPVLASAGPPRSLVGLEQLSRVLLSFAYVVSVAFYVRLLASFVLRSAGDGEVRAQLLTTAILAGIGVLGFLRGLRGLENFEEGAVGTKLAIIGGLLIGLLVFNLADPPAVLDAYRGGGVPFAGWTTVRVLAGMLLVVQGFETSRYLGEHYDAETRVGTMRLAQLISSAVYVVFVALSVRAFDVLPARVDETAILDMAGEVATVLVPLLVVAAIASQLSAAVADTAGGGEMLSGASRVVPAARYGYVIVTGLAIGVVWLVDVFAIISVASRAFAAFYLVQTVMSFFVLYRDRSLRRRTTLLLSYGALILVLAFIVGFAIPADS